MSDRSAAGELDRRISRVPEGGVNLWIVAKDLRPGDIVLWNNYPADILELLPLSDGGTEIVCGFDATDRVRVKADCPFNVIGHFDG